MATTVTTAKPSINGPAATTYNAAQLEGQYGLTAAFFNGDKALHDLIKLAVAHQWTADEFKARLSNTKWYQSHSDAQREWYTLTKTDPTTARRQYNERLGQVEREAANVGVKLPWQAIQRFAMDSLSTGMTTDQIHYGLAQQLKAGSTAGYGGMAGASAASVKATAAAYLVPLSDASAANWARQITDGQVTADDFTKYAREQAKSLFPGLTAAIDSGVTVAQYADPYKQVAAQTLEIPADSVNFMDPKWMKALTQVDPKTGARVSMSLSDWTSTLRSDPTYGYDKTSGARTQAADFATQIAHEFGSIG